MKCLVTTLLIKCISHDADCKMEGKLCRFKPENDFCTINCPVHWDLRDKSEMNSILKEFQNRYPTLNDEDIFDLLEAEMLEEEEQ